MTPLCPSDYAMVTVRLDTPADARKAFQDIKELLALRSPDIDEKYGAVPLGQGGEYVVMIEKNLALHLKNDNHPNIVGVFSNPSSAPAQHGQARRHDGFAGYNGFGPAQSWSPRNKGPSL